MDKYVQRGNTPFSDLLMRCRWGLLSRYLNGHKTLLDYGTGTGAFLKHPFRPESLSVEGYDINPFSEYHDVRGFLPKNHKPDVMTMYDVLEHLPEPISVIEHFRPKILAVSVPYAELLKIDELPTWRHFRPGEHLHYFTKRSLKVLMEKTGYEIEEVSFTEGAKRNPDRPCDIVTVIGRRV